MEFSKKLLLQFLIYFFLDRFMAFFPFFLIPSSDSHLSRGLALCMWQQSFVCAAPTIMERASETTAPKATSLTFCLGLPTQVKITAAMKRMPKAAFEQY